MFRRVGLISLLATLSAVSLAQEGTVLGQLGQAIERTRIYKAPNSRTSVYYTAKQYQYLIVKPGDAKSSYHEIVMTSSRGSLLKGYAKKTLVALLPHQVVAKPQEIKAAATRGDRASAAAKGLNYIGTPYVWGGNNITGGIDCSAFVQKLMGDIGLNLPRTAAEQARVGQPVTRLEHLQPGDRLYFWENKRGKIGHTGIYLGNGYFVHSSRGRGGVATDVLNEKWRRILVAARR